MNSHTFCSDSNKTLKIGVSACLMGHEVRFDSGHKRDSFITSELTAIAQLIPVCPEVESGMEVPRPAIQLRNKYNQIQLVVSRSPETEVTPQLKRFTNNKLPDLHDLDGYIFKKNSPSCGLFRVPIVDDRTGYKERSGRGIFAQGFCEKYPLIPVEEEGRLNDAYLKENFFERVYAYKRWKNIPEPEKNVHGFIQFHTRHKLMLMARGSHYYQELGQLVAGTTTKDLKIKRERYISRFMEVMAIVSTPGRQVNVLQHVMGYIKQFLSSDDKQELLRVFEAYRQKQVPLISAIILLRHFLRLYPEKYISDQHFLEPYPEQLALRSFV